MSGKQISGGVVHKMPADLRKALISVPGAVEKWESLTPLARNEFICWVLDAKQEKTREERIRRACEDLANGKRRPCCWIGCVHRKDKKMSASQKWILGKRGGKK
ncbi:MAG: YdeI/OmpD-associated family protein [Nanoarchaeota archaeon]|nr:YdeI/OmpD-associated family protein [Nanoarchaeota archaeon]